MRFDYKVKVFADPSSDNLEEKVNDWFEGRDDIEVIKVDYRTDAGYSVLVFYKDIYC